MDGIVLDHDHWSPWEPAFFIAFTIEFRKLMPQAIIMHAAFSDEYARDYMHVAKEVNSIVDFFIVRMYDQWDNPQITYESIFVAPGGTSLKEISQNTGVPMEKLIPGKTLRPWLSGFISMFEFGAMQKRAMDELHYEPSLAVDDYRLDRN